MRRLWTVALVVGLAAGMGCDEQPPRTCEDIQADVDRAIYAGNACSVDDDCVVVDGGCGHGLKLCHAYVNRDFDPETIASLGREFGDRGCTVDVCRCAPADPPHCDAGICAPSP